MCLFPATSNCPNFRPPVGTQIPYRLHESYFLLLHRTYLFRFSISFRVFLNLKNLEIKPAQTKILGNPDHSHSGLVQPR